MTAIPAQPPLPAALRRPPLAILAALAACGPLAVSIFVPALPAIARDMAAPADTVQWTLSLYFVGVALGQLVYGPVSDVHGRRGVVLGGISLYALACFGCYLAGSIDALILARFFQAVGGCVGMVISRAVIQDVFPPERYAAALSTVVMVSAVAPMLGPSLGGAVIDWLGWRQIFLILGMASALLVGLCWRWLPETNRHRAPAGAGLLGRSYLMLLRRPAFVLFALSAAILPSTYYAFMSGAPYLVISGMGWSASAYGLLAMTAPAGFVIGNGVARRLSPRLGNVRMISLGVAVTAAGLALALAGTGTLPRSAWALFLPMVVVTFGHGLAMTSGISQALSVAPELAGSSAAVIGCLQMLAASLIAKLTGLLVATTATAMLVLMVATHVLACGLFVAGQRRRAGGSALPTAG